VSPPVAGGPPPADNEVDVVVVNWNTGDCLRDCLAALAASSGPVRFGRVVVVDNASTDGSADLPLIPLPVTLVRNRSNRGFAAACNQGARLGSGGHVLLLNPDTVVRPDAVRAAVSFLNSPAGATVGICGGAVSGPDGSPGISASRFPSLGNVAAGILGLTRIAPRLAPVRHLPPAALGASAEVDQVIGAFFLVRRSLWDRLGGLDERYFIYYEEVDFCLRARRLGFRAYFLADAQLVHLANVSAKGSAGLALYHSLRSRTLYAFRHWTTPSALALVALTVAVELPVRLTRATVRGGPEARAVRWAAAAYLAFLARPGGGCRLPRSPQPTAGLPVPQIQQIQRSER
jgi:N-acetylglucosaminyl-diphospho-decaprenol L-rhamnosyltransferase